MRLFVGVVLSLLSVWAAPIPAVHGVPTAAASDQVLAMVSNASPTLFRIFYGTYFITPFIFWIIMSLVTESVTRVWLTSIEEVRTRGKLPPWPNTPKDPEPSLCIGELHYQTKMEEHLHPRWCVVPEKGLYTGMIIFGAIGTGKTAGCMKPFTRQLLEWQADDRDKRCAALVLEVKGDFCYDVQALLREFNRFEDYMEISLEESSFMWNPLACPWIDTYTLAYTLATITTQLFGSGKDPFWQQAYTAVIRWIFEAFRTFDDDWFTLADLHEKMTDPKKLKELVAEQEAFVFDLYCFQINVSAQDYHRSRERLETIVVSVDDMEAARTNPANRKISPMVFSADQMTEYAKRAKEAKAGGGEPPPAVTRTFTYKWLENQGVYSAVLNDMAAGVLTWELNKPNAPISYEKAALSKPTPAQLSRCAKIKTWHDSQWLGLDEKLRSSIVIGISVFLDIFVVPETASIFCPPSADKLNDEDKKRLIPPLQKVIEDGRVFALNMPAGTSAALARAVGVMLKGQWLSTLLLRPKLMALDVAAAKAEGREPKFWRPAVFICDEYQAFCTCGASDPAGDEKAFALTRQSRCIPIVATQSIVSLRSVLGDGETWRSLLQTLRTKVFLSLGDDFSQKTASEMLGTVERMKASYSLSENIGKASVSLLTGRVGGSQASAGYSKSYARSREPLFQPRDLVLQNMFQGIAQIFDGNKVRDATRVYLKPDYLPRDLPYWHSPPGIEAAESPD